MKKELKTMSVSQLETLKSRIEEELVTRRTQETVCIWGLEVKEKEEEKEREVWTGETYIS